MGTLQFVAAVVSSLAWPSAVCAVAVALRRPFARLLPRLSHLKYKDLEAYFTNEISEIRAEAQAANLKAPPTSESGETDLFDEVNAVAEISPVAAIPLAWTAIEREIIRTMERVGIPEDGRHLAGANIRILERAELIDRETANILNRLRSLRNEAAHAGVSLIRLSRSDVEEYARLAADVIGALRGIKPPPGTVAA